MEAESWPSVGIMYAQSPPQGVMAQGRAGASPGSPHLEEAQPTHCKSSLSRVL